MIYKIRHYNLRNNEILSFFNDVLNACNQFSTEPMKLAVFITVLLTDVTNFDKVFKLSQGSAITNELLAIDARRDNCLTGMHMVLDGYTRHFQAEIKKAAQDLIKSMDKYGKPLAALNYPAETSTAKSLVNDWTIIPLLANAIITVNFSSWVAELTTSNNLFYEKYNARLDEKSLSQIKTYDARMKAIASYKKLVTQIESGANFIGDNSFDALINAINARVAQYNIIADSHVGEEEDPA